MKIIGAGLNGLIGREVKGRLLQQHKLVLLRHQGPATNLPQTITRQLIWDPPRLGEWAGEL